MAERTDGGRQPRQGGEEAEGSAERSTVTAGGKKASVPEIEQRNSASGSVVKDDDDEDIGSLEGRVGGEDGRHHGQPLACGAGVVVVVLRALPLVCAAAAACWSRVERRLAPRLLRPTPLCRPALAAACPALSHPAQPVSRSAPVVACSGSEREELFFV